MSDEDRKARLEIREQLQAEKGGASADSKHVVKHLWIILVLVPLFPGVLWWLFSGAQVTP